MPEQRKGPAKQGAKVVGVCGAVGSGKSTVAHMLRRLGARVVDADAIAHEVLDDPKVRQAVTRKWGKDVLEEGGRVSRAKLGQKVFEKAEELRELERLIHPRVKARMLQEIEAAREEARVRLIVIDAPLLFEAGLAAWCDHRIFVDAPRSARLGWLARRQGWDEAAVEKRERAQLPLEEKRSKSDYFVGNFGSMEGLERQVSELYEVLTSA